MLHGLFQSLAYSNSDFMVAGPQVLIYLVFLIGLSTTSYDIHYVSVL